LKKKKESHIMSTIYKQLFVLDRQSLGEIL
jgi:hypothetical protein